MLAILEHLLIKNRGDPNSPKVTQSYAVLYSLVSIVLNLLLFAGKLLAGMVSGSVAITADAFNNLADAGTCGAELLGFTVAGYGAGETHPFGHGRIEWLMGLVASILVLFMGFEMAKSSIDAIRSPAQLEFQLWSLLVLALSIAVKFYMYRYNKKIGAKISSVAMKAKAYDCLGDIAATSAVLLSSLAVHFLGWQIDGWCGVAVSVFILYAGLQALKETAGPLMGSAPDNELLTTIETMCMSAPHVAGIYELMVHDYGFHRRMVSFHIAGDRVGQADELVKTASDLSSRLRRETGCEATIQVELLVGDEHDLLSHIEAAVRQVDQSISIKHLRLVQHAKNTVVTLDIIVPPELVKREDEMIWAVAGAVHSIDNRLGIDAKIKMSASSNRHKSSQSF